MIQKNFHTTQKSKARKS